MFDLSHPLFKPAWVRILLSTVLICWTLVEFATGNPFWGILVGALAVWAIWSFFVIKAPDRTGGTDE